VYQDVGQKYVCVANIINLLAAQEFLVDLLVGVILFVHFHSQIFEIYHIKKKTSVCVAVFPE